MATAKQSTKTKSSTTAKKTTKKSASSAKMSPATEAIYAAVGVISLEQKDLQKAYSYLVKKGRPRGKELEKSAEDVSKKARDTFEEIRGQFTNGTEDLSEKFNGIVEEVLSFVGFEVKEDQAEA